MSSSSVKNQALAVVFEVAAKAAKEEHDSLKKFEPIAETLTSLEVLHRKNNQVKVVATVKLSESSQVQQNEDFYIYDLSQTAPLDTVVFENLNGFSCNLAGLQMLPQWGRHELKFDDEGDALKVVIIVNRNVFLEASVTNYEDGSREAIEDIIENRQRMDLLNMLGSTGAFAAIYHNIFAPLLGALLTLKTIGVRKTAVQDLVDMETTVVIPEQARDLENFAEAVPCQTDAQSTVDLMIANAKLNTVASYYQTMDVLSASGKIAELKLESGTEFDILFSEDKKIPAWRIPFSENVSHVLLSDLSRFQIRLHNVPISSPGPCGWSPDVQHIQGGGFLLRGVIPFKEGARVVEALFVFDDSLSITEDFFSRFACTLDGQPSRTYYSDNGTRREVMAFEGMTVRPIFIQFSIKEFRPYLENIGVKLEATEPEEELDPNDVLSIT
ncbi:MAG: hypothetical protein SGILL_006034 [Bacillariaceae sp.]